MPLTLRAAAGAPYRLLLFLGGSGAKLSRPFAVSRTIAPATLALWARRSLRASRRPTASVSIFSSPMRVASRPPASAMRRARIRCAMAIGEQRFGWVFNPMSLQTKLGRRVRHQRANAEWIAKIVSRIGKKAGVIVQPAKGDGKANDTAAINKTIEAASAAGGATVTFRAGTYLSYSIHLKSNVVLYLGPGATVVAADTQGGEGYDPPEPNAWEMYQDFGHSHWHNSLIWGENLENITITGPGMIDGGLYNTDGINNPAPVPTTRSAIAQRLRSSSKSRISRRRSA